MILNKRYPFKKVQENLTQILKKYEEALLTNENFPTMERNFYYKTKLSLDILKRNNFQIKAITSESQEENLEIIERNHYLGHINKKKFIIYLF